MLVDSDSDTVPLACLWGPASRTRSQRRIAAGPLGLGKMSNAPNQTSQVNAQAKAPQGRVNVPRRITQSGNASRHGVSVEESLVNTLRCHRVSTFLQTCKAASDVRDSEVANARITAVARGTYKMQHSLPDTLGGCMKAPATIAYPDCSGRGTYTFDEFNIVPLEVFVGHLIEIKADPTRLQTLEELRVAQVCD